MERDKGKEETTKLFQLISTLSKIFLIEREVPLPKSKKPFHRKQDKEIFTSNLEEIHLSPPLILCGKGNLFEFSFSRKHRKICKRTKKTQKLSCKVKTTKGIAFLVPQFDRVRFKIWEREEILIWIRYGGSRTYKRILKHFLNSIKDFLCRKGKIKVG